MRGYTLYLKDKSVGNIFDIFCNRSFQPIVPSESTNHDNKLVIQWKNIHYLWKLFTSNVSIPNVIYSNRLKQMLMERYSYDDNTDSFLNITSKYLPIVQDFLRFWDNTIVETITYHDNLHYELDVDELSALFKIWSHENVDTIISTGNISDDEVVKIISYYYNHILVIDKKFIQNITSSMWNKNIDIENILEVCKTMYRLQYDEQPDLVVSIDDMYDFYLKTKQTKLTISKQYFTKFISNAIQPYILYSNCIDPSWYFT
jgi:hypothetical protein